MENEKRMTFSMLSPQQALVNAQSPDLASTRWKQPEQGRSQQQKDQDTHWVMMPETLGEIKAGNSVTRIGLGSGSFKLWLGFFWL